MMVKHIQDKLEEWSKMLINNDPNDCSSLLSDMMWDRAVANVYDRFSKSGKMKHDELINGFVSRHYYTAQLIKVRRLLDRDPKVSSLQKIIDGLSNNRKHITRRQILVYRNIEVDPNEAKYKETLFDSTRRPGIVSRRPGTATLAYKNNSYRELNLLCGSSLDDALKPEVIAVLQRKLKIVKEIENFVNVQIAHSALPRYRQLVPIEDRTISAEKLDKALEELVAVFTFLIHFINQTSSFLLPFGWEQASRSYSSDESKIVSEVWRDIGSRIKQWQSWGYTFPEQFQ